MRLGLLHFHRMYINYLLCALWLTLLFLAAGDCLKSHNQNKAAWVCVIVLLPFFGPLLYLLFGRSRYVSEL